MKFAKPGLAVVAAAVLASGSALAEPVEREAVILSVADGTLKAKSQSGPLTVVLTPNTYIVQTSGIAKKEPRPVSSLIPGLIFKVEGDLQGETVTAESIRFKEKDWRTAIATKAGTVEQFTELRQAIIDGQEYVVREESTVYFATGSAAVDASYQENLRQLAQKAPTFGNYRISVMGFADPRGNAEANERLSQKRATAVSNYLRQTGAIQPGRVLSPSAMGEGTAAPGETAPTSNDEARRVVVRVVTPKGQLTQ